MTPDIVALGYIFNEHIAWPDGRTEGPFLGATLSYGAVTLGRLGTSAGIVTNIGHNTPQSLLAPLYQCGVDLSGLNVIEGAQETRNVLNYRADGTKVIDYLSRAPVIEFSHIPKAYLGAKAFHFCLVDYEVPIETMRDIRKVNKDALFTADLGGAGGAHSTPEMRNQYVTNQKEYLGFFDIGKASLEDAELAFGRPFSGEEQAADAYLDCGMKMVVITLGERGAYIKTSTGDEYNVKAIAPEGGVVDTTGAGDTYITAFVARYLETSDITQSANFASATASLLIEKGGGVNTNRTPDRQMVNERLVKRLS